MHKMFTGVYICIISLPMASSVSEMDSAASKTYFLIGHMTWWITYLIQVYYELLNIEIACNLYGD